jgi:flagellar biosynthesis chaperone FliJ
MKATGNVQELARAGGASRSGESDDDSVGSFNSLLRRISEVSTSEIENLIGELQKLRRKLQTDGSRVQSAIAEYAELNQQVMQLTKIISDSVKKLPNTAGVGA